MQGHVGSSFDRETADLLFKRYVQPKVVGPFENKQPTIIAALIEVSGPASTPWPDLMNSPYKHEGDRANCHGQSLNDDPAPGFSHAEVDVRIVHLWLFLLIVL